MVAHYWMGLLPCLKVHCSRSLSEILHSHSLLDWQSLQSFPSQGNHDRRFTVPLSGGHTIVLGLCFHLGSGWGGMAMNSHFILLHCRTVTLPQTIKTKKLSDERKSKSILPLSREATVRQNPGLQLWVIPHLTPQAGGGNIWVFSYQPPMSVTGQVT